MDGNREEDREALDRIGELVDEEHEFEKGGLSARGHERLLLLEVELDQCWDLRRQRRVLREADYDPAVTPQASYEAPGRSLV